MTIEKLTDNWLFESHSKIELMIWLGRLNYFYFIRAWGGQANDGDVFKASFRFLDRTDLINKLKQIGIELNVIPDELKIFKSKIYGYEDLEQPGHKEILGNKVFIWVIKESFSISISGNKDGDLYEVSEVDFQICQKLENHFEELGWKSEIDRSIEKDVCCISRTKYPELYNK